MDKNELVTIFNNYVRRIPMDINKIVELISYYFEEIDYPNRDVTIKMIAQQPNLALGLIPEAIQYFSIKYTICSIIFNNQILMYYVSD